MLSTEEILSGILIVSSVLLLWCYLKRVGRENVYLKRLGRENVYLKRVGRENVYLKRLGRETREGYGNHYQPEIQENTMLMRGPFDDMDYVNPVLLI